MLQTTILPSRQVGISLIEVLVVLVIIGLLSTIAINGGSNALLMKQKLQNAATKSFNDNLVHTWFRHTISHAYPLPESSPIFSPAKIQFITQGPLVATDSIQKVSWSLAVDGRYVVLSYSEGEDNIEVRRWFEAEASFEFLFEYKDDIYPSFISLEVDYLSPSGRKNDKVLAVYLGEKEYPADLRQ